MDTLLIAIGSLVLYIIAYFTYGKWLGSKVFGLVSDADVPSKVYEDGEDFVPTKKSIVFGHHFTSIAGTGPIVGPAVAVMWGWVPALLWVLFGSIFIGAVHDFGALVVSLRNQGKTVGEIAGDVINKRVKLLFLIILSLALTIVLAIFGLVISKVFLLYPGAITPCLIQIPLAIGIGLWVRKKGGGIFIPSIFALCFMYLSVIYGDTGWLADFNLYLAQMPLLLWVAILLIYSYFASILPVWILLQPRDYINSLQLLSALSLVVIGLIYAGIYGGAPVTEGGSNIPLEIVAPAFEKDVTAKNLPMIMPFLFVTIACGAISGFHCLVSSGTSSKQISCESDARFIGYGSMLTEGFLAVLVILACVAGIGLGLKNGGETLTGVAAWEFQYGDYASAKGLGAKVGAFVSGTANFLRSLGLSREFSVALMGVFVASFAATTLDTACRLQRYILQELFGSFSKKSKSNQDGELTSKESWYTNKYFVTLVAISTAFAMAFIKAKPSMDYGTGGIILWPLFGAINQLLAGLAFLVIVFWMRQKKMPIWFLILPTIAMLIFPAWAMAHQVFVKGLGMDGSWIEEGRWLLVCLGIGTLILEIWMIIEAIKAWNKTSALLKK